MSSTRQGTIRLIAAVALMACSAAPLFPLAAQEAAPMRTQMVRTTEPGRGPVTKLPMPRYVSLKGSEGNARRGPSLSHRIDWVFKQSGMPLRVVAEYEHWRRVEDRDGTGGWVYYTLLSGARTAEVTRHMAALYTRPNSNSDIVAKAEAGAVLKLNDCNIDWCNVSGGGASGWIEKTALWGVDPDEIRK